jgi:predicted phosphodiesterase
MKLLILSDIHGNRFGLEAALKSAGSFDALLCLGDVVGYGAHPNECCEILRQHDAICLSGNHDAAALKLIDTEWFNDIAAWAIDWTREQLSPENARWLRSLPGAQEFPEWRLQAVHGSLRNPWEEYILDLHTAVATIRLMTEPLCFFGHTHQAIVYAAKMDSQDEIIWREFEDEPLPYGGEFEIEAGWRFLVNPGSCGQPRDGNPQARYATLDSETGVVKIEAVDYDMQAARQAILDAGLPRPLGDRLLRGR